MRLRFPALASAALVATLALAGCSATEEQDTTVIAPVIMSAEELQGESVELQVGQAIDITTGDLDPGSYSGEVTDETVASFEAGGERDGATFNPGVLGVGVGETDVTLSNDDGGIQDVQFTVTVVE
ncbi:hypothetical protein M4I32_04430 [Microbacterium sp. LRZ72]|uniref:hypothetical protein n=1 Tax=Microbacterium sp. LRZ72 TaxID=2942481 RepID=UPI0029BF773A|nr:hypothetical protein [Microbacterium sp. LRZ72]MDX2376043.1 hypothetical protein [Microbacterium sp. LRZ72]